MVPVRPSVYEQILPQSVISDPYASNIAPKGSGHYLRPGGGGGIPKIAGTQLHIRELRFEILPPLQLRALKFLSPPFPSPSHAWNNFHAGSTVVINEKVMMNQDIAALIMELFFPKFLGCFVM